MAMNLVKLMIDERHEKLGINIDLLNGLKEGFIALEEDGQHILIANLAAKKMLTFNK